MLELSFQNLLGLIYNGVMLKKLLGVFVIFVAAYMGAHYYIRWKNTVYDDVTKIGRLVECSPNDFRALAVRLAGLGEAGELRFERTDQPEPGVPAITQVARWRWRMSKPISAEADPDHVRRIASTICELYDPTPLRAGEGGTAPDESHAGHAELVEAKLDGDGKPRIITFVFTGAQPEQRTNTVLKSENVEAARSYRIPDHLQQVSSLPVEEFRNKRVMRSEADNVQQIELSINGKERFTLEREGGDWVVLADGKKLGAGSDEAAKFVNRMTTLRAIDVKTENFGVQDCAEKLRNSATVVTKDVTGYTERVRFEFGKSGNVLACSTLGTQEFEVHRDVLPFLDVPVKSVLAKK